ncbi:hypothetical protein FBEOM_9250 [Fusarium beomiforme]|uniref:Ubiquitin-like domain-containing protein n=1 Tax=Fusarium beomiforme TaxID=44412 RepID=A0A9P5ADJ7_9HYPO|nr:hypothetical protein FBEOM_9250 [Fusarium beomiforme]
MKLFGSADMLSGGLIPCLVANAKFKGGSVSKYAFPSARPISIGGHILHASLASPYYVNMSFGYAVGDVIAVLGLFERIAIELRNYKDAPMHFQRLRAELDLVRRTLKHVLIMEPESPAEHQTLEKIRSIIMHCSQPLQSMADKMRAKESSLGHFKTTRSLSSIGTRLHWSMIAQGDVEELRKTIMSQMAAINILLSVQQMNRIQHIALQSRTIGTSQSLMIEKHANAIAGHASNILTITSRTQIAIDALAVNASTSAQTQSKQANLINKNLNGIEKTMLDLSQKNENTTAMVRRQAAFLSRHAKILFRLMQDMKELFTLLTRCSREMLQAISRNTCMLLDITAQLKHIIRAIEAIPLHLTLDIIRLDDAHGESWALPLQACTTWELTEMQSFSDMLRFVVYANNRPGADYITHDLFDVANAKTGKHIDQDTWATFVKPGFHVEQAMIVKRAYSLESCTDPDCPGALTEQALQHETRQVCALCGRWATTTFTSTPLIKLYNDAESIVHPELLNVQARVDCLEAYMADSDNQGLTYTFIHEMIDAPLHDQYYKVYEILAPADDITLNPVHGDLGEDDGTDEGSLSEGDDSDWGD